MSGKGDTKRPYDQKKWDDAEYWKRLAKRKAKAKKKGKK